MQPIRYQCMLAVVAVMALAVPVHAQSVASASAEALPALNLPPAIAPVASASPVQPSTAEALPTSSAATTTATPDAATLAATGLAQPVTEKSYSFGDSNLSIFFLPDQVTRMKDAIRTFEDTGKDAAMPTLVIESPTQAPVAAEALEDPLVYPVFYLASIVYDSPKDWSLWISGYKITSRKNDTDVRVLNVTPDSATFLWTPSFSKALGKRTSDKLFAPLDSVKSKMAGVQRASFDMGTGSVVFTLKQNQTFAVGYFKTFEGYIEGPTLTPLPVEAAAPAAGSTSLPASPALVTFDSDGKASLSPTGPTTLKNQLVGAAIAPPLNPKGNASPSN